MNSDLFLRLVFGSRIRAILLVAGLGVLDGCSTVPRAAPPLSAESTAAAFAARSLQDAGLHRFLVENLGREPVAWDFETLSWAAFYFNPSLDIARAQWAASRAAQQTAAARPNPTLTLTPGYTTTPGETPWLPSVGLGFLFETAGKRDQRAAIEKFSAEAAQWNVLSSAWQVRSELRRALADAATAAQREALLHAQADVQQKLVTLLAQRLAAGSVAALNVSAARSALYRIETAAAEAASQMVTARTRVATALGLPLAALTGVELPAPTAAPALPAEALVAARGQSLQSRADVLGALARYESAQAALQLEAARRTPDVNLNPTWERDNNKWSVPVTFEVPLFHPITAGPLAEAEARLRQAAAEFNAVQAQAIAAIDGAAAAQTAASAQLAHARQLRAEVEKQNALTQQRFDLGAADQVELQTARIDLAAAALALLDAETAAALAAGQLEDALQVPFSKLAVLADSAHANFSRRP